MTGQDRTRGAVRSAARGRGSGSARVAACAREPERAWPAPPPAASRLVRSDRPSQMARAPGPIFGQPLDVAFKKLEAAHPEEKIPYFLAQAFRLIKLYGLQEEGIGRLSGHAEVIDAIRDAIHADINELPETLIPRKERGRVWAAASSAATLRTTLSAALPGPNLALLRSLADLFHHIWLNAHVNKMPTEALVKLLAPNLLPFDTVQEYQATNAVATLMVEQYPAVFDEREVIAAQLAVRSLAPTRKLFGHRKSVLCMTRSECGRYIVTGDSSGLVLVWDVELPPAQGPLDQIALGSAPVLVLAAAGAHVWAACIEQLHVLEPAAAPGHRLVRSLAVGASCVARVGPHVWAAGHGPTFRVFQVATAQPVREIHAAGCGAVVIRSLTAVPATRSVWAACTDRHIRVFSADSGELLREFKAHTQQILSIEPLLPAHPGAPPLVCSTSDDKSIRFWHMRDYTLVGELNVHSAKVYGVVQVGAKVWSYGWDRHVVVSDLASLRMEEQLEVPHTDAVSSMLLQYSRRHQAWQLWSASWDRSLCVSHVRYCRREGEDDPTAPPAAGAGDSRTSPRRTNTPPGATTWQPPKPRATPGPTPAARPVSPPPRGSPAPPGAGTPPSALPPTAPSKPVPTAVAPAPVPARKPAATAAGGNPKPFWQLDPHEVELNASSQTLGKGTFGTVFKATLRGKPVAVKKFFTQALDDHLLEDFRNEVMIMSSISHPNVLLFMGACFDPGNLLIVTELMPRGNVEELLYHKDGPPPLLTRMRMAKDAAQGMTWLHCSRPPFLHLDLKPANLLVDSNGTVKVADFGFALIKRQQWPEGKQPVAKGTPIYAAPEVLLGRTFDEKADVFSFGMVLWEMFTCEFPWANTTTLKDHVRNVCVKNERPPIPVDCPPTLRELIQAAWHLQPERRPHFEDMLPRFDFILIESGLRDQQAIRFWKSFFPEEQRVPQARFLQALAEFFSLKLPSDDVAFKCVAAVLADPQGEVALEALASAVEWFGPFDASLVPRVLELLRQPHFHGDISAAEAQRLLAGEKKGAWLLRFSSKPGDFSITIKADTGAPVNYRIEKDPRGGYTFGKTHHPTLDDVLKVYKRDLGLKLSVAGSKYEALFAKRQEGPESNGYCVADIKPA